MSTAMIVIIILGAVPLFYPLWVCCHIINRNSPEYDTETKRFLWVKIAPIPNWILLTLLLVASPVLIPIGMFACLVLVLGFLIWIKEVKKVCA